MNRGCFGILILVLAIFLGRINIDIWMDLSGLTRQMIINDMAYKYNQHYPKCSKAELIINIDEPYVVFSGECREWEI